MTLLEKLRKQIQACYRNDCVSNSDSIDKCLALLNQFESNIQQAIHRGVNHKQTVANNKASLEKVEAVLAHLDWILNMK